MVSSIPNHPEAVVIVEKTLKPVQAYPGTSEKALHRIVVPKRDLYSIDGDVLKNNRDYHSGKQQQIKLPVAGHTFPELAIGWPTGHHSSTSTHARFLLVLKWRIHKT